ncbi:MAG: hypothetical protein IPI77_16740 [Saprospiraceae bacterium]|nr:hypothetical protein [Saprospiraceae bacterium]
MHQPDSNHKFIEAWGIMASTWGVSRSESQVYALLLIQNEQMSAEAIMADLHMSREMSILYCIP